MDNYKSGKPRQSKGIKIQSRNDLPPYYTNHPSLPTVLSLIFLSL